MLLVASNAPAELPRSALTGYNGKVTIHSV